MNRGLLIIGVATLGVLAACGGQGEGADAGGPAAGDSVPVQDGPPAAITNPASPPPIGTDVGAASGDTVSEVIRGDTARR